MEQKNTFFGFRSDHYCSGLDKPNQGVCRARRNVGGSCIEDHHCIQSICLTERYAVAGFQKLVIT